MDQPGCGVAFLNSVRIVERTGSTNADLLALAQSGKAQEGDWLMAETQSGGRGRRGHVWSSPRGNLYASTVVELRPGDPPAQTLSFAAGWALWSAAGVACASLKWPNDLMVGDRKLAGILLERSGDLVVVGFGLNIAIAPDLPDRRTTCLNEWWPHGREVPELFEQLQEIFAATIEKWRSHGFAVIRGLWQSEAHREGEHIRVALPNGMSVEGAYAGLAEDGGLRLLLASGRIETVHVGEIAAG